MMEGRDRPCCVKTEEDMEQAEFDDRMNSIDQRLAVRGCPVSVRPVMAWRELSGAKTLDFLAKEPKLGPYEGPNLYWSVQGWYTARYPTKSVIGHDWGPRPIIIRGLVYLAEIPVIFNTTMPLDAFRYLPGVPDAMQQSLTPTERAEINTKYNRFFIQGFDLAMAWSEWHRRLEASLASQLLDAGRADLRMASEYAFERNPGSVLFAAQQGPEKFLKALLVVKDPSLTEPKLKKKFNHKIPLLFDACVKLDAGFEQHRNRIAWLAYGPEVRY